jgi:hypothetical protein
MENEQSCKEQTLMMGDRRPWDVWLTEEVLVGEIENLQEELNTLQEAVAAAQPYVPRNSISVSISVVLLQYNDAMAHIDQSLRQGHVSREQAQRQQNGLADVYAAHITDLVCGEAKRPVHSPGDAQHCYLVQFRKADWEYFKTDCAFRQGQLDLAMVYVWSIVDALEDVVQGRVLDAGTHRCVYRYP